MKKLVAFIFILLFILHQKGETIEEILKKRMDEAYKIMEDPRYKDFFYKNDGTVNQSYIKQIEKGVNRVREEFLKEREIAESEEGWNKVSSYKYYLFISSSIPYTTLYRYSLSISKHNKENQEKIVMVLRGCVKSRDCAALKPTIEFIKNLLTLDGKYEKGVEGLEVWIDPVLFREYKIDKVPCLVYKNSGKYVCGDYSLEYLISQIREDK